MQNTSMIFCSSLTLSLSHTHKDGVVDLVTSDPTQHVLFKLISDY